MASQQWREELLSYPPGNQQERRDQKTLLLALHTFGDLLIQRCPLLHLTCMALVVNQEKTHALMVHHNLFQEWSLPGGHMDGDSEPSLAACREVREETGLVDVRLLDQKIFSLDILPVMGHWKKGQYVSAHTHAVATFLLEADGQAPLAVKPDENSEVKWIPLEELPHASGEPHMRTVYEKLLRKLQDRKERKPMKACGTVHKYGDNVDTDVIIPARYLNTIDHKELASHCMEDIDKDFGAKVQEGDIMVAHNNFGCGSSREHAPIAIKASGISCVIASTFARIFYRNAINTALPILECPEAAEKIQNGDQVEVDFDTGVITNKTRNETYQAQPFPDFIKEIIAAGGLLKSLKK